MTRENIIEKIQKLARHEESARKVGSVAEAELFAEKINELLIKHRLEMDDIAAEGTEEDLVDSELFNFKDHGGQDLAKRSPWQSALAHCVAKYHFCKTLVVIGSNRIYFVGRREDRSCAIFLFAYLHQVIAKNCQKLYDREYNRYYVLGETYKMRDWKNSFYIGAIHSLSSRFEATRAREKESEQGAQFALVLKKSEKELGDFIAEAATGTVKNTAKTNVNTHGYRHGMEFGEKVSLVTGVETTRSAGELSV